MQQAWKPGGEGTTRLFYVVAAEEFVEAARIFGDFFYGVAQLGWNECGGRWVASGWITGYRRIAKFWERKNDSIEREVFLFHVWIIWVFCCALCFPSLAYIFHHVF